MKIPKKFLWGTIICLGILLIGETYICRHCLKDSFCYYRNKVKNMYDTYISQKKSREELSEFLNSKISEKTIAIFEPNNYHHECMPGYAKYFTDLGYNVDVLITTGCEDSLEFFEPKDKLRIFKFSNLEQIKLITSDLSKKFSEYDKVLLHTTDPDKKDILKQMGFFDNKNSLFIMHHTGFIEELNMQEFCENNRIFTLGDFDKGLYVNPHYFGEIPEHTKNKKTRFFITSTHGRKYSNLIETVKKLKNQKLDFEILVVGRSTTFSQNDIPEEIRDCFIFKHGLPYVKMYEEIQSSDYILMLLDPDNEYDLAFKSNLATGTAQLAYGFLKPVIAHSEFATFYKFDSTSAFIYNASENLEMLMKNAITLNENQYSEMQYNVKVLSDKIFEKSIQNLKKAVPNI